MRKAQNDGKNTLQRVFLLASIFLTILLAGSFFQNLSIIGEVKARINKARIEKDNLQAQNSELKSELSEASSAFYSEKQARDKLGLAKEGEIVLVLPEGNKLESLSPLSDFVEKEEEWIPNWRKWLDLFFE